MIERVFETISRYSMFERGQSAGVAVSGGADSMCLLHVLREIAPRLDLSLRVLHLNHMIRGEEAEGDEDFVRELAARLALPFHEERIDVPAMGGNLEQAARRARREFFARLIREGVVNRAATGHTLSDQAETVLFRFLRGAGATGLSAIRPVTTEGLVRPLLEIGRAEVEGFLRQRGIPWREDSTNAHLTYARNRIRHELLPALTRDWNPKLPETLARMAELARDEEEFRTAEIDRLAPEYLKWDRLQPVSRPVHFNAPKLTALPKALARRLLRRALELAKGDLRGISFAHIEEVLALAMLHSGHARRQIPGLDIIRSFDEVRIAHPAPPVPDVEIRVQAPGCYEPWGEGGLRIQLEIKEPSGPQSPGADRSGYNGEYQTAQGHELDWERISGGVLILRNWRAGDQYRPFGHSGQTKLKHLFQQARIPLWSRPKWPILACGQSILWAAQFGPASEFAATAASRTVLKISQKSDTFGE